jgi:hypothetical protein
LKHRFGSLLSFGCGGRQNLLFMSPIGDILFPLPVSAVMEKIHVALAADSRIPCKPWATELEQKS